MSQRQKLLDKIRALLAKTTSAGCTESEAFAALAKAQELMDAYEVMPADLKEPDEKIIIGREEKRDRYNIRAKIAWGIAKFLDIRGWDEAHRNSRKKKSTVAFAGPEGDVLFAYWLLDTLVGFCERGATEYILTNPDVEVFGYLDVDSFCFGCATRIFERLKELAANRHPPAVPSGKDLVVSRHGLIARALQDAGIHLQSAGRDQRGISSGSFQAGRAAGDKATFNRPVHGTGPGPLAITKR